MQSVPITTDLVRSNLDQGEVYKLQHYVIKFVRQIQTENKRVPRTSTFELMSLQNVIYTVSVFLTDSHDD
jgi:hypothetical protein